MRSQTKEVVANSMTISKKLAVVNGLKYLFNEPLMPQDFQVPASRGNGKRKWTCFFNSNKDTDSRDAY